MKVHLLDDNARVACNYRAPIGIWFPDSVVKNGVYTPRAWMSTFRVEDVTCLSCLHVALRSSLSQRKELKIFTSRVMRRIGHLRTL